MDELFGLERHDGQAGHSPIFWFTINSYSGKEEKKKKVKCKIHPLSFTIFHFSPLSLGFFINPLTFIHFQLSHPLVFS